MTLTHFMNNKILRGFLAVALVILLADPCGHLIAASSSSTSEEKDYWKMTQKDTEKMIDELHERITKIWKVFRKNYENVINQRYR